MNEDKMRKHYNAVDKDVLIEILIKSRKEIEGLNKLISQREKKWEKWTTEKQILSSKMSDYLCKYQNIKREYTKQIKISTDRKNEIERLNNIIDELEKYINENYIYDEVGMKIFDASTLQDKLQELKGENNDIMKVSKEKETKGSIFCCDKELLEILDKEIKE